VSLLRTRRSTDARAQRVGETDLLVETDLTEVEVGGFAEVRPDAGVERRELHDHRSGYVRPALEVSPKQPAEQPDADGDLLEFA